MPSCSTGRYLRRSARRRSSPRSGASRDLDVQYKTAFVLARKLREALAADRGPPVGLQATPQLGPLRCRHLSTRARHVVVRYVKATELISRLGTRDLDQLSAADGSNGEGQTRRWHGLVSVRRAWRFVVFVDGRRKLFALRDFFRCCERCVPGLLLVSKWPRVTGSYGAQVRFAPQLFRRRDISRNMPYRAITPPSIA